MPPGNPNTYLVSTLDELTKCHFIIASFTTAFGRRHTLRFDNIGVWTLADDYRTVFMKISKIRARNAIAYFRSTGTHVEINNNFQEGKGYGEMCF